MDIVMVIIMLLSIACVWLFIKQKLDDRKLQPYTDRLGRHGIRVRTVGFGCRYCQGQLMHLSREVPTEPPPGAHDLHLTHEENIATFCTKCGAEKLCDHEAARREPNNLFVYMDKLDKGGDV